MKITWLNAPQCSLNLIIIITWLSVWNYKKALHRKGIYLKSTGSEKGLKKSGLTRLRFGDRVYGMRRLTVILEFNIEGNLGTNSFYLNSWSSMTWLSYSFRILHQNMVVMLKEAILNLYSVFNHLIIQCLDRVQVPFGIWNITMLCYVCIKVFCTKSTTLVVKTLFPPK